MVWMGLIMATIKTSQKRARMKNELKSDHGRLSSGWVWLWPILVWMGLIINAHLDLGNLSFELVKLNNLFMGNLFVSSNCKMASLPTITIQQRLPQSLLLLFQELSTFRFFGFIISSAVLSSLSQRRQTNDLSVLPRPFLRVLWFATRQRAPCIVYVGVQH